MNNKKIDEKNTSISYYLKNMRNDFTADLDYEYSAKEKQSLIEKWIEAVVDGTFSVIKENGKYKIIDGQKRLTAINDFVDGKIKYHGKIYSELSEKDRQKFLISPLSFNFFDESIVKIIFMKPKFD